MDDEGEEVYDENSHHSNSQKLAVLTSRISNNLSSLSSYYQNSGTVSIFKVPEKYRNRNKEAYTPRLVSIGAIHYGEAHLKAMERHKLAYLKHFLSNFRIPLDQLVEFTQVHAEAVCQSYDEIYSGKLAEPSEVILLDGIFMVVLFLKNHYPEMRDTGDAIFENPSVSNDILHDLMLIENQLPLWFLITLYNNFVLKDVIKGLVAPPSFLGLVHEYFQRVGETRKLPLSSFLQRSNNLVEFLLVLYHPWDLNEVDQKLNTEDRIRFSKLDLSKSRPAKELEAAGVEFSNRFGKYLLDISFRPENGVLRIPTVTVNDSTETFFHNLIAIEQTGHGNKYITSYVILMASLMKTQKDVDLLIECGIVRNHYGSSAKVAKLFGDLYTDVAVLDGEEFLFSGVCAEINHYSRDIWHRCKAKIAKTPIIQAISAAAIIGTILGIIQTVCSVLQVTSA